MKPNMLFAAWVIGMTLTVGSASGQTLARFEIPFDFSSGKLMLPAGEYTVSPVFPGNRSVLAIRRLGGIRQIFVQTDPAESVRTPSVTKMVFRRYGDTYFLSQIWIDGQTITLPIGNREREMERSAKVQVASICVK